MKKILITGASSGIGYATSALLAQKGHRVLMAARRIEKLQTIAAETPTVTGELIAAELDITDMSSVDRFMAQHQEWLRDLDVLVNNAGLALGRETLQVSNLEDIEIMIDTNLKGLLRMTHKVLPAMVARKSGHVINLGSIAGRAAYQSGTVYCATKAAVHMITDALRIDLGGTGIRVSTVAPGRVAETDFSVTRYKGDVERARSVYEGFRTVTARDIAQSIAWIIEQPAHVNIQELVIMPTDQPTASTLAPMK